MADIAILNSSSGITGKTVVTAEGASTVTGAVTFDRDPSAPFLVSASSAKVSNLDADLVDGQEGSYYTNAGNLTGSIPGTVTADVGTGTETVAVPGRVASITAAVATTGTSEEVLASYTLPANTLATNGSVLRISGSFTTAANGNDKTIRIHVNGANAFSVTTAVSSGTVWFSILFTRRTSSTGRVDGFVTDGTTPSTGGRAVTLDFTVGFDINVSGITPSATGDMTLQQAVYEVLP